MRSIAVVGAISVVVVSLAGCTVHGRAAAYTEPVGTTYVTSAPVEDYTVYPHTEYEGRTVYYYQGRWGYPNEGRWVTYRDEPPPLVRYRTRVQEAPPAHRYDDRRYDDRRHDERRHDDDRRHGDDRR